MEIINIFALCINNFFYIQTFTFHSDLFGAKANFDSDLFKNLIMKALKGLHGDVGGSISVDIIRFEKKSLKSILRVPSM